MKVENIKQAQELGASLDRKVGELNSLDQILVFSKNKRNPIQVEISCGPERTRNIEIDGIDKIINSKIVSLKKEITAIHSQIEKIQ